MGYWILALICAFASAVIARYKGRSPIRWFFGGLLLSVLGLIIIAVLTKRGQREPGVADSNGGKKWSEIKLGKGVSFVVNVAESGHGQIEGTIEARKEAARVNLYDPVAHFNLGVAYGNLGHYHKALKAFRGAIRINPDYTDAYFMQGVAYISLRHYHKASKAFKEAIRVKPDSAETHFMRGLAYISLKDYFGALEALEEVKRLGPDQRTYLLLGHVWTQLAHNVIMLHDGGRSYSERLKRYKNAAVAYKEAVRMNPGDAVAHFGLGSAFVLMGNKGMALEEYKILKELDGEKANELFKSIYK